MVWPDSPFQREPNASVSGSALCRGNVVFDVDLYPTRTLKPANGVVLAFIPGRRGYSAVRSRGLSRFCSSARRVLVNSDGCYLRATIVVEVVTLAFLVEDHWDV